MIDRILSGSLRQRPLVLLASLVLLGIGLFAAFHLPVDAVPDITNVQVQINTSVPSLAPEEAERLVTVPIEIEMSGLPGLEERRSLTKSGLSQVTLVSRRGPTWCGRGSSWPNVCRACCRGCRPGARPGWPR